jgi:hypothetical protein
MTTITETTLVGASYENGRRLPNIQEFERQAEIDFLKFRIVRRHISNSSKLRFSAYPNQGL